MVQNSIECSKKAPFFGIRHLQCFLLFWGITIAFAVRVNLSLAIVAMTDKKSTGQNFDEYHWSEKTKSILLSSFFWGYVCTQILGGFLARKFGGKYTLLIGVSGSSITALFIPLGAKIGGWKLVCVVRIIQGLAQGIIFPTIHTILSKWAPAEERGMLGTFSYSGAQFGTVIMLFSSGFIAASPLGWPNIFYIPGGLAILWTVAWYIWGASTPNDYKTISLAEKQLIENSISNTLTKNSTISKQTVKIPWLKFLTSIPLLSILVAHCAYNWGFWTILTEIPSYMKNIMGFNIKSNALLTSLPYFVMFLLNFVFIGMGAFIEKRKWLNLTQSRKVFNTISSWIPAVALCCLGYVDASQPYLAVLLLIIAVGFASAMHLGFQINHIDLSPNFAGILLGCTNTMANTMSVLAPLTVGFIVTEEKNVLQWRLVFLIAAGFCFFGNLVFIIFGSGKVQPWNEPEIATEQELKPMKSKSDENEV